MDPKIPFDYVYIHDKCKKPAFYADHLPGMDDLVTLKGFYHLDGKPIEEGEVMICDSCMRQIWKHGPDPSGFKKTWEKT